MPQSGFFWHDFLSDLPCRVPVFGAFPCSIYCFSLWFLALLGFLAPPRAAQWPRQRLLQFRQVGPLQWVQGPPVLITQPWRHAELQPCGFNVCGLAHPTLLRGLQNAPPPFHGGLLWEATETSTILADLVSAHA